MKIIEKAANIMDNIRDEPSLYIILFFLFSKMMKIDLKFVRVKMA